MNRAYDAIVIGAGVIGASTAFHLTRAGLRNVLVLERKTVCAGNTRKSGALIRVHYSNEPEARLALASLPYFEHWGELVGGEAGFQQVGFVLLVGPNNAERLRRNLAMLQRIGVNTRQVDAAELREIQPGIVLDDGALAAYEPDGGFADPVAATESLVAAARIGGATVREGVAVTAVHHRGGRVTGVGTIDGDFEARLVVCAANVWSPPLLRTAGVEVDLWAHRSQLGFYQRPAALAERARVVLDLARGSYCRPEPGNLYLIGGSWAHEEQVDPERFDEGNDAWFPERARREIAGRLPALADAAYVRGQAGVYDMSPDTRAILDRAPGLDGLIVAVGFSGTGFKTSPIVGRCLAELATEGRATSADLHPFRFSRFAENDPITSADEYELAGDWGIRF